MEEFLRHAPRDLGDPFGRRLRCEALCLDGVVEAHEMLVETGNTLEANNLEIIQTLKEIEVYLVANPAYYKLRYSEIRKLVRYLNEEL